MPRRMAELEEFLRTKRAVQKGRIVELQTALSELAASQVAITEADWR